MMRYSFLVLLAALGVLSACQTDNGEGDHSTNLLAKPAVAPVSVKRVTSGPGLLLGSWASSDVISAMDQTDRLKNQQAEARAFTAPIGQLVTWNNPDDQKSGTVTPLRDNYNAQGAYCRDFQQTVALNGQQKQGYAKACQVADGSWKTENR